MRGADPEFFATPEPGGIFFEISPFEKGHGLHPRRHCFIAVQTLLNDTKMLHLFFDRGFFMTEKRIDIPKLQGHSCFACGTENPIGLNLQFYRSDESICTDITLGKYHEGWQNMAHGGIISTLLDEVMSWTIIYFKRIFFVTRRMEIKYVRPVLVGVPLTVKGRLTRQKKEPFIGASAEVFDAGWQLLAKATGEFVELPKDKLELVPEELKEDMVNLFNKFRKEGGENNLVGEGFTPSRGRA